MSGHDDGVDDRLGPLTGQHHRSCDAADQKDLHDLTAIVLLVVIVHDGFPWLKSLW